MYMLFGFNVLINTSDEGDQEQLLRRLHLEGESALEERLGSQVDFAEVISSSETHIEEPWVNAGPRAKCNAWTTDMERQDPVRGLEPGARINGVLLCNEHLPPDHPIAF